MHRPHFPVAVVGHPGHGKSTLCEALVARTGGTAHRGDPRRLRACRLSLASKRVTLFDVPGGRRSLHAAMRACAMADAAVLVVSSTSGPQAQTREHLLAARAAGLAPLIVVINDRDGDRELLEACEHEVRGLLVDQGDAGDDTLVITAALDDPAVLDRVLAALEQAATRARDDADVAVVRVRLFHSTLSRVARTHLATDEGSAVASGRVLAGTLKSGELVRVLGRRARIDAASFQTLDRVRARARESVHDVNARIARLEIDGAAVDAAQAGELVGMHLVFAASRDIVVVDRQSSVLVSAHAPGPSTILTARLALRPAAIGGRAHPLVAGFESVAWTGSSSTSCVVLPVDAAGNDVVVPAVATVVEGGTFDAVIVLALPRFAPVGLPLVLTDGAGVLASGVITESRSAVGDAAATTRWLDRLAAVRAARAGQRLLSASGRRARVTA